MIHKFEDDLLQGIDRQIFNYQSEFGHSIINSDGSNPLVPPALLIFARQDELNWRVGILLNSQ